MTPPTPTRLTPTIAALGLVVGWVATRQLPPWGDEAHFLSTVRLFAGGFSVDLLRTYPEMSGPLPFMIYGAWGHLVGLETVALRALSPVIALATILVFDTSLARWPIVGWRRAAALVVIVGNPYFAGLSVFVFTDMLALLGLATVLLAVAARRPWAAAVGMGIAVLSRQYLAFLAPALIVSALLARSHTSRERSAWIVATLIGMAPLGGLVVLWGGLSPDNDVRRLYLAEGLRFDPHALSLYLAITAVYLAPLLAVVIRSRRAWEWAWLGGLAAMCVWLWPVAPSTAQTSQGIDTVGFLDRALHALLPPAAITCVYVAGAFIGTWALAQALWQPFARARVVFASMFLAAAVVSFLVVMPFSYMPWEKYALPLLMVGAVALTSERGREQRSADREPGCATS